MIEWSEILIRLAVAAVLGLTVGLERERHGQAAGMRTHMMVCVGSTLIMIVSVFGFSEAPQGEHVRFDVARLAAQVVSGIGFLGAGTILFMRDKVVRGLTTAAGLWTVAAIGLAVGGGMYFAAIVATTFVVIILLSVQPLERRFLASFRPKHIKIVTRTREQSTEIISSIFDDESLAVETFSFDKSDEDNYIISLQMSKMSIKELEDIVKKLQGNANVKEIMWES